MSSFTKEKMTAIKNAIDSALSAGAEPIAAFDADGTLWAMDMGEYFFDYQIQQKLLSNMPADPWAHYRRLHAEDEPTAFLWLAQINKGVPLEQVRNWATEAYKALPEVQVFSGVKEIIQYLQKAGVKIYVVTASIKWAVEPGAEYFGIPRENVIGVTTKIENGIVSDVLSGVVTWREGKVKGLLSATQNTSPFFAAGNTMGDFALLDLATHLRLANCAAPADHPNYETEQNLVKMAKERGWFYNP